MEFPLSKQAFAVVIGISHYPRSDISPLPAAAKDAIHFARAIKHWGIAEVNIFLLLNSNATIKELQKILDMLESKKDKYKLIFYFCGHGYRDTGSLPESYLLFSDGSVNLDHLLKKICSFSSDNNYVFIDACQLRINQIINPRCFEELEGKKISEKNLFCLLSSGIEKSYENKDYGYFTDALLKGLSLLKEDECSPTALLRYIQNDLKSQKLPLPEMYTIGDQRITFNHTKFHPGEVLYRFNYISKIQDKLIQNRYNIICLIGHSGSGKTFLAQSLRSEKLKIFYLDSSSCDIHYDPHSLVVIDHIEQLNPKQLNQLFEKITKMKNQFVLISDYSITTLLEKKFKHLPYDMELTPFSYDEGYSFVMNTRPFTSEWEYELFYLLAKGNPLKLKKAISLTTLNDPPNNTTFTKKEVVQVISAIVATGAYINESLFVNHFDLQEIALDFLKANQLIIEKEESWIPNHLLYELAEAENSTIDSRSSLNYWYDQLDQLPNHIPACKALILVVKSFGYEEKSDKYLKQAFQAIYKKELKEHEIFVESAEIYLEFGKITESSLVLIEILLEYGFFDLSEKLLSLPTQSKKFSMDIRLSKIHLLWKTGFFEESISLCTDSIKRTRNNSLSMQYYFHRGISYFLNGHWENAKADFTVVYEKSEDVLYMARAQSMLGYLLGIKGIDLQLGKDHLEKSALTLSQLNDSSGAWAAWNNLGEILWKSGEYRSAGHYLEKALKTAYCPSTKIETLRNFLHLRLRTSGPYSKQVSSLLAEIENMEWDSCNLFTISHLLNTLTTVHIFRQDFESAFSFLKLLVPLTKNSPENHIYTLSNVSLIFKMLGMPEKTNKYLGKAMDLASQHKSLLTLHQLQTDHKLCMRKI